MLSHFSWCRLQDLLEDTTKAVTKMYMYLHNKASLQTQNSYSTCLSDLLLTLSNLEFWNVILDFKIGIKATEVNLKDFLKILFHSNAI